MTGAMGLMTTTIPMIVATYGVTKVIDATFKRNGKPVGRDHYHFRGRKPVMHKHEGGHIKHEHKSYRGYGRSRKTLKKL